MDTNSQQFPADQQPDPNPRAEDRVFDAIQDSDHAGFANHDGQPNSETPGNRFHSIVAGCGRLPRAGQGRPEVTGEEQVVPGNHEPARGGTLPDVPGLGRSHGLPRRRCLYPERFPCPVIAVVLFPEMEQDPAIVAEVMRSNVQVLWGQTS